MFSLAPRVHLPLWGQHSCLSADMVAWEREVIELFVSLAWEVVAVLLAVFVGAAPRLLPPAAHPPWMAFSGAGGMKDVGKRKALFLGV